LRNFGRYCNDGGVHHDFPGRNERHSSVALEIEIAQHVDNKINGIEGHYKVKILEETKGNFVTGKSPDTVVLIAYKCMSRYGSKA